MKHKYSTLNAYKKRKLVVYAMELEKKHEDIKEYIDKLLKITHENMFNARDSLEFDRNRGANDILKNIKDFLE